MIRLSFQPAAGALVLMLTVVLSLMMIRSPGTSDVALFLKQTDTVYQSGLAAGYSNILINQYCCGGFEYPPGHYANLYVARALGNAVGLSPLISFKVLILIFQLVSAGIILLISGDFWVAAALNASFLLSAVGLGYTDIFFAPWLIVAFWAFQSKRYLSGTALFLIACFTKWQPIILAPFIAVYLLQISDLRSLRNALNTWLFWQLVIVVLLLFALLSLVFGIAPLLSLKNAIRGHPMVSGNALNLPWIAGCLARLVLKSSSALRQECMYVVVPSLRYLLPIKVMFAIVFGAVIVRMIQSDKSFQNCLLFSIIGFVSYLIWNTGVHENHWFSAVVVAFMLMLHTRTREHWAIVTILVVMANINLFVFYGITGTELESRVLGLDLSIVLAILYAVAWLFLAMYAWQAAPPRMVPRERSTNKSASDIS